MNIEKKSFGKTLVGNEAYIYTLKNSSGMSVEITDFGGIVLSIKVPDKNGRLDDIVLNYDKLERFFKIGPYFGAIIGRYANRIENAAFELNGVQYNLYKNDGENTLHGGLKGFDKVLWNANILENKNALELTYLSKDGEEGFPGNLEIKVTYTLTKDNSLKIEYYAVSDKDTVVNLTNHSYFNLSGHASGSILKHKVMINADKFTPNNQYSIPTGEIKEVKGTPMDFTKLKEVGEDINKDYDQFIYGHGYDHNWVLNVSGKKPEKAAEVVDENSGRILEVYTTKPGIQFYAGYYLDNSEIAKDGVKYRNFSGLCLETQYFPNSIKYKHFPSPILGAGEEYKHTTIYKFL